MIPETQKQIVTNNLEREITGELFSYINFTHTYTQFSGILKNIELDDTPIIQELWK